MSEQATRTALVRVEKDGGWTRIKRLVLDSVTSPHSKRAYEQALDAFQRWCAETGAAGFTKATVQAYRAALEAAGMAASSINVRLSAIRKLAAEAADNGLLAPEVAAAVSRVRGAKRHGVRAGNWLTLDQAERLLELPDPETSQGKARSRAAGPAGRLRPSSAGARRAPDRRHPAARRPLVHRGPSREGKSRPNRSHAALGESRGRRMAGRCRFLHGPGAWRRKQGRPHHGAGHERPVNLRSGRIIRREARSAALAPHDVRRTFAKLAHKGRAPLEQIQISLGHASIQTTERYLGVEQDLTDAPCDHLGIRGPGK